VKGSITPSDSDKWQAVVGCDKSYDGAFFYGVTTTRVFCRPSCKSRTPVRDNVVYFDTAARALETGFRPCKRCCPDKPVFEPDLELVERAKDSLDADFLGRVDLTRISRQVGVSRNHLTKLFRRHCGLSPTQYVARKRVDKAEELLGQGDMGILEIAYAAGFVSLSNFYRCFRAQTGLTPTEYRTRRGSR
jgi:AraC family transcriptional regulator, regulatory protein of adaptative response / methylphosphotriester-DNA alkyltransferase methyltransferase